MKTRFFMIITIILISGGIMSADTLNPVKLPSPSISRSYLLETALKERKSSRDFADRELTLQELSDILWCANGINRPDSGGRTSPSAMNKQDIEIYVFLKNGAYCYDYRGNTLQPVAAGDFRAKLGMQPYVATAPLNLIYVSDLSKFSFTGDREMKMITAGIDAGHCSQNVYLYCAAAHIGVVVRTSVDKKAVGEILKLKGEATVIMGQTIGYPR